MCAVRIDHGVVLSDDLGKPFTFFTDVLDVQFMMIGNLNLRGKLFHPKILNSFQ